MSILGTSSQAPNFPELRGFSGAHDSLDLASMDLSGSILPPPYPWVKAVPEASMPPLEDRAVDLFFERYVMYPCNNGSSPGFLEHLPGLFNHGGIEGRYALRWAVRAAAYAGLSNDQIGTTALATKALECYGRALAALAESLADPSRSPDDHVLMTVVVLDLFEVSLRFCSDYGKGCLAISPLRYKISTS